MNLLASMRYLLALNEHRHFGRAAQACHITQPALSNALKALEQEFGVVIVQRGRTYAGLTHEGERVLLTAQRMVREREILQDELNSGASRPQGSLRLGAVPTAVPVLAHFAALLHARHPGISPVVRSMSSPEIEADLDRLALEIREQADGGTPTVAAAPEGAHAAAYRDIALKVAVALAGRTKDFSARFPSITVSQDT